MPPPGMGPPAPPWYILEMMGLHTPSSSFCLSSNSSDSASWLPSSQSMASWTASSIFFLSSGSSLLAMLSSLQKNQPARVQASIDTDLRACWID